MIKTNVPTITEIETSKKEIVTVVNRFGREVEVSKYQYLKMVKNGECEALEKEDTSKTEELELEKQSLVEKVETLELEVSEKQSLVEKLQVELDKLKSKPKEVETKKRS